MKLALLLVVVLLCAGCSDHKHNFFKPEVPDATFAVVQSGDPTADDARGKPSEVKAELDINIRAWVGPPFVGTGFGDYEGFEFIDNGAYYCAPSLNRQ